jgi:putative ABC transport system permease protein
MELTMWRTTIKTAAARWRRLLLTGAAVVLGIAFVTGALVLTDTSSQVFDGQFADASAGVDLVVRSPAAFGAAMGVEVERDPLDERLLAEVRATPGVRAAAGKVTGSALLVVDQTPVVPDGPSLGLSWEPAPFNPFTIRAGRPPAADTEVVVDAATAAKRSISVGEQLSVQLEGGQQRFTVVGLAGFGQGDGLPNATVALFAHGTAQRLFDLDGKVSEILLVTDGPTDGVRDRLAERLDDRVEITTAQATAAASAAAAKDQLGYVKTMLLVLAATALLVGAFLIANTFSILVAQRTRELAMLRAVGATGRQVTVSVLAEAAALGLLASAAGSGLGIVAAAALRRLVTAGGVDLPAGALVVAPRTIVLGLVIGLSVTLLSTLAPARRAARIAPVTAMRDAAVARPMSRRRTVTGLALVAAAVAALTAAVAGRSLPIVGLATALILTGVTLLAPAGIGPVVAALGRPLTRLGVAGKLSRANAVAAPRRTAATATALAIGLAVVTFMTVIATSVKSSIAEGFDDVITADAIVESARGEMLGGLSPQVHHHISELPEVAVATPLRFGHWLDGNASKALTAVDPATLPAVAKVDMLAGDLAALRDGGIILAANDAANHGVTLGDQLTMTLPRSGDQRLCVVGIVDDASASALSTGYLVSLETYAKHFGEDVDASVLVRFAPGVAAERGMAKIRQAIAEFPTAAVRDQAEARASRTSTVDSVLALVTVLLLLAVLIALLGIANTLGLSIIERTREVGLLRAVGMGRRQVAWMVRLEAVLVAAVGAVAGVALGLLFGWVAVAALTAQATVRFTVPATQLLAFLVVAAIGGGLAGMLPARRASRLDVLAAVSSG